MMTQKSLTEQLIEYYVLMGMRSKAWAGNFISSIEHSDFEEGEGGLTPDEIFGMFGHRRRGFGRRGAAFIEEANLSALNRRIRLLEKCILRQIKSSGDGPSRGNRNPGKALSAIFRKAAFGRDERRAILVLLGHFLGCFVSELDTGNSRGIEPGQLLCMLWPRPDLGMDRIGIFDAESCLVKLGLIEMEIYPHSGAAKAEVTVGERLLQALDKGTSGEEYEDEYLKVGGRHKEEKESPLELLSTRIRAETGGAAGACPAGNNGELVLLPFGPKQRPLRAHGH